jgi:hypothetical protein
VFDLGVGMRCVETLEAMVLDSVLTKVCGPLDLSIVLATYNLRNYFRYILLTLLGNGTGDRISKC